MSYQIEGKDLEIWHKRGKGRREGRAERDGEKDPPARCARHKKDRDGFV